MSRQVVVPANMKLRCNADNKSCACCHFYADEMSMLCRKEIDDEYIFKDSPSQIPAKG